MCVLFCFFFFLLCVFVFFFQAEDGIRDLVRSRGLGDVYKRQVPDLREKLPGERVFMTARRDVLEEAFQSGRLSAALNLSLIHI